ncbi:CAP domain-containing protein [Pseudarthrobacter sp. BIM B-2242]|uniref:CAP domain-containing protein n=1 Tax=Pseudarthrobacter sp. BIM B-2242 TaxID=2772401 RepID=UPI00168B51A4|nr:CAP domain-containing protein [Pseudarthrobacter sp. BIM B-2242]QOD05987.1 hypothetical protein IDT60_20685 [Pseudarthrobacter sp. BIM B-2242]
MKHRSTRVAAVSLGLALSLSGSLVAATAATAAPAPTIVASTVYDEWFTKQTFDLINAKRAAAGSRPFVWNQRIADVSQDWANKLGTATKDPNWDFGTIHRPDAGGSLIPSGSTWYRENIGFNGTPQQIVDWWMNSPGHKAAMLDPRGTDAGLGYVVQTSGPYAGLKLVVSNMAAYPTTQLPSTTTPSGSTQTPLALKAAQINGALGLPTSPEVYGLKDGGAYRMYQLGALIYSPASGARISFGAIRTTWASQGFEAGPLGYPTTDEVGGIKDGGVYQNYQGGAIVWSPTTGAQISSGPIRTKWLAANVEAGPLGYPVSGEVKGLKDGGSFQNYQGGTIMYSPATGARISIGAIRTTWASTGYENGSLGYPTSDEYKVEGGVAQNYQGGVITHNYSSGNRIVSSEMAGPYKEHGAYLGTAVADRVAIRDGGFYQNFIRGSILWSPATGAQISIGGIRSIWASVGYENGVLGYPTSGELAANGGVYQNYQHGVITWHGTGGGHFVFGGIGSMYKSAGGATGRLGLATSGEYLTGGGNVSQNFQGGTINWGPSGNWISYK